MPGASNVEVRANSVVVGNKASKEERMNNKVKVQLHLMESDERLLQI